MIRSKDAVFLLYTSDPDEKLSWEKGILPDEDFLTDLEASKCDDFGDPIGYYVLLVCIKISGDAQIKDDLLQDKSTIHRIFLAKYPDKSSNPKNHDNFNVANNKWEIVNAVYNVLVMSDDVR